MIKQQDIFTDLPRGEQLAALRNLRLQTYVHKGRKVSAAIQKATIRAIDDHQGRGDCFASQETLADEVGCGKTAIGLAIAALIAQDLITADRPHRMAPNRHRVVWSSVFQLIRAGRLAKMPKAKGGRPANENRSQGGTGLTELGIPKNDSSRWQKEGGSRNPLSGARQPHNGSLSPAQRVSSYPLSVSLTPAQRLQNAPETQIETPPPNDGEVAVAADLYRWGLKSAKQSVDAARSRGWSVEYVRELRREFGDEPERWEPGQLANWLTGKTFPPFDEAESDRRAAKREAVDEAEADEIRESINSQAERENRPDWIAAGIIARKLKESGLDRFTTPSERDAAVRLDEADSRRRSAV